MLSKVLNTKTLIILLVIAGAVLLFTKLNKKEDRTFKSELVSIDTARISKIVVIPKIGNGDNITMVRTGGDWSLESSGRTYKSDKGTIRNVLAELARMRTERVAATDESKWAEMEVTDSTGTRIQLFDGDDIITDLYLGKFSYTQTPAQNPQQRQQTRMFSSIRPVDDDLVYIVEGFIKMTIQPKVNAYRAKTLCALKKEDIKQLTFTYAGQEPFTVSQTENGWLLNGEPADSANTIRYLANLAKLTSSTYIDEVEPTNTTPSFALKIDANNSVPIELKAFDADSVNQYVVTSSLVSDAKYSGSKNRLFGKVFVEKEKFLKED